MMLLNPYSSDIVAPEERKKNNVNIAVGRILENICPCLGGRGQSDQTGDVFSFFHHAKKQLGVIKVQTFRLNCRFKVKDQWQLLTLR